METHIDILQQFMALNREFDTDVPIEVNEAIEELINENFHLTNRVKDLESALIDTDRLMQEYLSKCLDLEHRLSTCIEPKFKVGQEVYMLDSTKVKITGYKIINFDNLETLYRIKDGELAFGNIPENELFATKKEAKEKLEELKNE